jgi:hypothetical protein
MTELDHLYTRLLHLGFVVLRLAAAKQNQAWLKAELEMLHNVPSLIGESKIGRHAYYWEQERTSYLEWVQQSGNDEAVARARTFYEPIWAEMESLMAELQLAQGITK